jgi:hypothetical protein
MKPGRPRHRSQNPRGESEVAGSDCIKVFEEALAVRRLADPDHGVPLGVGEGESTGVVRCGAGDENAPKTFQTGEAPR